ncbi:hypothetical protein GGI12_001318 [Dipsacomyces acuminosporus]|nr:hypothetical protein GGI12_001318 [Dipsacomyces acuminosporus]
MHAIGKEYLAALLHVKEDARLHMVREARELYCELQDQATVAYEHMDAGAELAADLQRLLTLSPSTSSDNNAAPALVDTLVSEAHSASRSVFVESMTRAAESQVSRVRVESELRELKYMAVQGKIVETVGDMSAQHKEERARLEASLADAQSDYGDLQKLVGVNRAAFEARISELEAEISGLRACSAPSGAMAALKSANEALEGQVRKLSEENAELEARIEVVDYEMDDERTASERQRAALESQLQRTHQVLEQCEVDMATQVDQINSMRQYIAEVESEQAILAEQSQFQINWLKENYASAYRDLDAVLSNNGGHANLRQRIKYVENLKTQILALKRENFDFSRDRDRYKHQVRLLKSELDAYKEVSDMDAFRSRSRVRGRSAAHRTKSTTRGKASPHADANGELHRTALEKRGASIVARAMDEARQRGQMGVADDDSSNAAG